MALSMSWLGACADILPIVFVVIVKHCSSAHHVAVKHIFNYAMFSCFSFGLYNIILYTWMGDA